MTQGPGFFLYVAAFVLAIGPLVFIHEMGHYLVGRWCGIGVDAFSIGFGREVVGVTDRRGTRWKAGWLPLGGYVKFAGDMNPASQPDAAWLALPPAERARTFQAQPVWKRALTVAAGPAVNFLAALLILGGFALAYGDNRTPTTAAQIERGTAAYAAGLRAGDRITAIDGNAVETFNDLAVYVRPRAGERVRIDFVRGARPQVIDVTIGTQTLVDRFGNKTAMGLLGIAPTAPVWVPVSVVEAPVVAVRRVGMFLGLMVETLRQIVTGQRALAELHGPIGTAQAAGEQILLGPADFIYFVALISINLGFINLLPIPMLDGGHLLFYAIESVRRRPVRPQVQDWAFRGGLAALLALMVFVTANDLGSFGLWQRLAGLIG